MRTRPALFLVLVLTLVASVVAGLAAITPAVATAQKRSGFSSTIRLSNCSAFLVRFPSSRSSDRAMMMTAGHCWLEGRGLYDTKTVAHRPSSIEGTVLGRRGNEIGTVRTSRLIYATEEGTDLALYRLTGSFADVRTRTGARPLTLAASGPAPGSRLVMPAAGPGILYHCSVQAIVPSLLETGWTWHDAVRFTPGDPRCQTINGTSGSPLIDRRSGQVVALNNTIAPDDMTSCDAGRPCEVSAGGTRSAVPGARYAEQTSAVLSCVTPRRTLGLGQPGCLLQAP